MFVLRASLATYNALTDNDPNHYTLYSDDTLDYVLIKEKLRGSVSVNGSNGSQTISHGLGYVPLILAFYEVSSGVYRKIHGQTSAASSNPYFVITSADLILRNPPAGAKVFKYFIFYDLID